MIATLLSVFSCGGDGMEHYNTAGLKFSLPDYMKKANVNYADVAYANNDGCEFFIYFYSSTELLTVLYIDKDSTVLEYADWFVGQNGYTGIEREYDEANCKLIQSYIYESEDLFFYDYIVRNETNLYHITMSCRAEDVEYYKPLFDEWAGYIELTDM